MRARRLSLRLIVSLRVAVQVSVHFGVCSAFDAYQPMVQTAENLCFRLLTTLDVPSRLAAHIASNDSS